MDLPALRHLARLAEVSLSPEEEPALLADLDAIVAYVGELERVDTSTVAAAAGVLPPAVREDEPKPGLAHDDALAASKRTAHGGFCVPTFVE